MCLRKLSLEPNYRYNIILLKYMKAVVIFLDILCLFDNNFVLYYYNCIINLFISFLYKNKTNGKFKRAHG